MSAEVIRLNTPTTLDLPTDLVLNAALDHALTDVVIVGRDADGELFISSSRGSVADAYVELGLAQRWLLDQLEGGPPPRANG